MKKTRRSKSELNESLPSNQSLSSDMENQLSQQSYYIDNPKFKNEKWTRLVKINDDMVNQIHLYQLQEDYDGFMEEPLVPKKAKKTPWQLSFDPDQLGKDDLELKMADFKLQDQELWSQAVACTTLRERIRGMALQFDRSLPSNASQTEPTLSRLAQAIEKGYHRSRKGRESFGELSLAESTAIGLRRRKKWRPPLSTKDKLDISYRVIKNGENQAELAHEYRVTCSRISQIVQRVRKEPKILSELLSADHLIAQQEHDLVCFITGLVKSGSIIERAEDVRAKYEEAHSRRVKISLVRQVMRAQLDMRYKKIIKLAPLANQERCRVQRQQAALVFLQALHTKQRVITIDESWIDSGDYRRRCWQMREAAKGLPIIKVRPRISLILAFDNKGGLYASLLQANSDSDIMQLFLKELIQMLDEEDKNWRKNTMLVWDGAPYHKAKETLKLLEDQQVPIMFLGPYMYLMAPPELVFAALKYGKLNLGDQPLGKKNFATVVHMVVSRLNEIPKAQLMMMWHHVVLNAFKFLSFEKL